MKIIRGSAQINIPIEINYATTFLKRLRGLAFQKGPLVGKGLYLAPCSSIHMFFMFFPIDAVFVDKKLKVVQVFPNLRPWKSQASWKGAYGVIELPSGSITTYGIKENDQVIL